MQGMVLSGCLLEVEVEDLFYREEVLAVQDY